LDEPNANLDAEGEAMLMTALARLSEAGATTIIVSHRVQVLRRADQVLVLEGGKLARLGPRDTILSILSGPARAA
jgi:ATP-binding cassette subfamily C protein